MESLLVTILIGAVAGWLAGVILKWKAFGLLGNIIIGIIGAYIGSFVFGMLGISASGLIGSIIVSTVGAIILLIIIRFIKKS